MIRQTAHIACRSACLPASVVRSLCYFPKYFVQLIIDKHKKVSQHQCISVDAHWSTGTLIKTNETCTAKRTYNLMKWNEMMTKKNGAYSLFKNWSFKHRKKWSFTCSGWIFANIMCCAWFFLWLLLNLAIIWNVKLSQTLFSFWKHETINRNRWNQQQQQQLFFALNESALIYFG